MGEIADDLIGGSCCNWCSCYFEEDHGYPVICRECFDEWVEDDNGSKKKLDKLGLQIALESEV